MKNQSINRMIIAFISLVVTLFIILSKAHGGEISHTNDKEEGKTVASPRSMRGVQQLRREDTFSFLGNIQTELYEQHRETLKKEEIYLAMIKEAEGEGDFYKSMKPTPESDWKYLDNRTCVDDGDGDPFIDAILHRAPAFMILGAMKAGTSSLASYLTKHSQVVKTGEKEYHFFDGHYRKYKFDREEGIPRNRVRKQMYLELFPDRLETPSILGRKIEKFETNHSLVSYHDSPRLLFWSDRLPQRILCVAPWTKMLAAVREPVARAFSHYNMKKSSSMRHRDGGEVRVEFDSWVQKDIDDLIETGVLQTEIPLSDFIGSPRQLEAWKRYTRLGSNGPIGRGLYVFQLNEWFQAWKSANKNPNDFFFIVNSEQMKEDSAGVYRDILKFLKLADEPLKNDKLVNKGTYVEELNSTVRETLQDLYAPYNEELYKLLGTDWDGIWDYSPYEQQQ